MHFDDTEGAGAKKRQSPSDISPNGSSHSRLLGGSLSTKYEFVLGGPVHKIPVCVHGCKELVLIRISIVFQIIRRMISALNAVLAQTKHAHGISLHIYICCEIPYFS